VRATSAANQSQVASFRAKLLVGMMVVVFGMTAAGLYLAQRNNAAEAEHDLQHDFQAELAALDGVEELRHAALAERCRVLAQNPRIHAALEDNALDLLYPSAKDELRDVMAGDPRSIPPAQPGALRATFYRFLDGNGAVLPAPNPVDVGPLKPEEEAQLALKPLPQTQQIGYVRRKAEAGVDTIDEVIALPIHSTETNEVIAALVVGFEPAPVAGNRPGDEMKSGIWVDGWLHMPALAETARAAINQDIARALATPENEGRSSRVAIEGAPHLLFYKGLNPGSAFPPAYEVCIYSLHKVLARQRRLRWQIVGAGAALLIAGFVASHFISKRLSKPVEQLAVDSEENRARRKRVEAALASTHEELERSTRFSADASHQLKTPVTVLRAGLEGLLHRDNFPPDVYEELSALHHQTYRLTAVIDDLLLLSRMDAGRLQIEFNPVNLTELIEGWLEDFTALPDPLDLEIKTKVPRGLYIAGERRYASLILQNLLENARKYNHPGGSIRVSARTDDGWALLRVGNTGPVIPPEMQEQIFERFSRATNGSKVAGHGLGLNLARELVRLHGGELRLVSSIEKWTEFEVRFRLAHEPARNGQSIG
jgi:signal transduction histidine kinase